MKKITDTVYYIGVDDHEVDLFEGQYVVPEGMAYNSYVIMDERVAVMDTVDIHFTSEWLANLAEALGDRKPDYLVIQHMEPDHSASIGAFLAKYPDTTMVATDKAFKMLNQFQRSVVLPDSKKITAGNMSVLELGSRALTFVLAPMVHWPEVMVTYDPLDKILFSADAFGKFGALDPEDDDWACEARRYYFGIVGKYGAQVQALLKKLSGLDVQKICALHGPVLSENLSCYLGLYDSWSRYLPEDKGIFIAYTSVYGNTEKAALLLEKILRDKGAVNVSTSDLARDDWAEAVEDAFRYDRLVLATTTYNGDVFPAMASFISALTERNYQNRSVALIENGSWAPQAARKMKTMMEGLKNISWLGQVTIVSSMSAENEAEIAALADTLIGASKNSV